MKSVLLTLTILLASQVSMAADRFYDCVCSRGCQGSELLDVDMLSNGKIVARMADSEYEVSERINFQWDANYNPRTRDGFARYLPHSKTGNMYKYLPTILVEKSLWISSARPSDKVIGIIYAQWLINGKFSENIYRCNRTKERHITN